MKIVSRGAICLAAILLSGIARADAEYDACMEKSDGSNTAWGACGYAWVDREQAKLDAAWLKAREGASPQGTADLLAEQTAWTAYKDVSCQFLNNGDYGREGQVLEFPACRAKIIAARTADLIAYETDTRQ